MTRYWLYKVLFWPPNWERTAPTGNLNEPQHITCIMVGLPQLSECFSHTSDNAVLEFNNDVHPISIDSDCYQNKHENRSLVGAAPEGWQYWRSWESPLVDIGLTMPCSRDLWRPVVVYKRRFPSEGRALSNCNNVYRWYSVYHCYSSAALPRSCCVNTGP